MLHSAAGQLEENELCRFGCTASGHHAASHDMCLHAAYRWAISKHARICRGLTCGDSGPQSIARCRSHHATPLDACLHPAARPGQLADSCLLSEKKPDKADKLRLGDLTLLL